MKKRKWNYVVTGMVIFVMLTEGLTGCGSVKNTATSAKEEAYVSTVQEEMSDAAFEPAVEPAVELAGETAEELPHGMEYDLYDSMAVIEEQGNNEEYAYVEESGYQLVEREPLSTFSADVDTASYANLRRMIQDGYRMDEIPANAIRIEEMINYFDYDYTEPSGRQPISATVEIGDCPWNEAAKLMLVGMQTKKVDFSDSASSNLVFLLDVSGSMYDDDKLPLLQKAFSMLAASLTGKDRVSIVTYAGSDEVLIEGVRGSEYDLITDTLNSLYANGSTAGSAGIITAYEIAEKYFIEGGNNRVILATDGDLNVGLTTDEELEALITEERETGVYLSVLGFGTGNLKDSKMEILADKGNGNYAYIDSTKEAKKVLVEELGSTLITVAKDVKFQVEFNPSVVSKYRLIGYDNRALEARDFNDDTVDAGEIGAGHSVTALYEIITTQSESEKGYIPLKYQEKDYVFEKGTDGKKDIDKEWLTISVRYKEPEGTESKLIEYPITSDFYTSSCSDNWNFACAVAEFGMLLRDSENKGSSSYRQIERLLDKVDTRRDEYKEEFTELVKTMRGRVR